MAEMKVKINNETYARWQQERVVDAWRRGESLADGYVRELLAELAALGAKIDPDFQTIANEAATRKQTGSSSKHKGGRKTGVRYDPWEVTRAYYDRLDRGEKSADAKAALADERNMDMSSITRIVREHSEWPWCADEKLPTTPQAGGVVEPTVQLTQIESRSVKFVRKDDGSGRTGWFLQPCEPDTRSLSRRARDQARQSAKLILDGEKDFDDSSTNH
ncbi:MAG: hypothetical protein EOO27_03100 [Comamonadaceae bacterium]|nr:MAG: hypothetical protein EOO27_03100 [Comamonadaceae bacterium]